MALTEKPWRMKRSSGTSFFVYIQLAMNVIAVIAQVPRPTYHTIGGNVPNIAISIRTFASIATIFAMLLRYSLFFMNVATVNTVERVDSKKLMKIKENRVFTSLIKCGEMLTTCSKFQIKGTAIMVSIATMTRFDDNVDVKYLSAVDLSPLWYATVIKRPDTELRAKVNNVA